MENPPHFWKTVPTAQKMTDMTPKKKPSFVIPIKNIFYKKNWSKKIICGLNNGQNNLPPPIWVHSLQLDDRHRNPNINSSHFWFLLLSMLPRSLDPLWRSNGCKELESGNYLLVTVSSRAISILLSSLKFLQHFLETTTLPAVRCSSNPIKLLSSPRTKIRRQWKRINNIFPSFLGKYWFQPCQVSTLITH